jgi:hypothetical protein
MEWMVERPSLSPPKFNHAYWGKSMTKQTVVGNGYSLPDLKAKRNALLKDIKYFDDAINALEQLEKSGLVDRESLSANDSHGIANELKSSVAHMSVSEGSIVILKEAGHPMKTKDILAELIKRGKNINSKKPITAVFSTLYKTEKVGKSKLKNMGEGLWGLS